MIGNLHHKDESTKSHDRKSERFSTTVVVGAHPYPKYYDKNSQKLKHMDTVIQEPINLVKGLVKLMLTALLQQLIPIFILSHL